MSRLGAWGAGLLLLGGLLIGLWGRGEWYRQRAIEGALRADSLEAIADTTRRTLNGDVADAERRALQVTRQRDSLDKALHRTTALLSALRLVARPLDTVLVGVAQADSTDDVRRAVFHADSPPYHADAAVRVPRPPLAPQLVLGIRLDTASIMVRAQCGQPVRGVKPATLFVMTPSWLTTTIDTAQLTPLACNTGILQQGRHRLSYFVLRGGFLAGAGYAVLRLLRGH